MVAVGIGGGGRTTVRFGIETDASCACDASNARISSVPFPAGIPVSEKSGLKNGIIEPNVCASSVSCVPRGSMSGSGVPFQNASICRIRELNGMATAGLTNPRIRDVAALGTLTCSAGVSFRSAGSCASATAAMMGGLSPESVSFAVNWEVTVCAINPCAARKNRQDQVFKEASYRRRANRRKAECSRNSLDPDRRGYVRPNTSLRPDSTLAIVSARMRPIRSLRNERSAVMICETFATDGCLSPVSRVERATLPGKKARRSFVVRITASTVAIRLRLNGFACHSNFFSFGHTDLNVQPRGFCARKSVKCSCCIAYGWPISPIGVTISNSSSSLSR